MDDNQQKNLATLNFQARHSVFKDTYVCILLLNFYTLQTLRKNRHLPHSTISLNMVGIKWVSPGCPRYFLRTYTHLFHKMLLSSCLQLLITETHRAFLQFTIEFRMLLTISTSHPGCNTVILFLMHQDGHLLCSIIQNTQQQLS